MGVSDIDTGAIRDRAGASDNSWSDYEVVELCDEVGRLRARLVEVEAERDRLKWRATLEERRGDDAVEVVGFLEARADAAEARLAKVEALAKRSLGLPVCGEEHLAKLVLSAVRGEGDRG